MTGTGFFLPLENDMIPIELRVDRHFGEFGDISYTITKVWPGIANTGFVAEKFPRYYAAVKWAREHYPETPVLRNYTTFGDSPRLRNR